MLNKMEWSDGDQTCALFDGVFRARIYKMHTGFWFGEVFYKKLCAGHTLTKEAAKAACEALWLSVRDEQAKAEACPQAFAREVSGDYPRVFCKGGCGCWNYARPCPGCEPCVRGTIGCDHQGFGSTFVCGKPSCRMTAEVFKAMNGEPSVIERIPERTPEENAKLFAMLRELDAKKC